MDEIEHIRLVKALNDIDSECLNELVMNDENIS